MDIGKLLIIGGVLLISAGIVLIYFPKIFYWFGDLPGDIRINRNDTRVFIPITSMILLSVIATGIINLISWLISKIR